MKLTTFIVSTLGFFGIFLAVANAQTIEPFRGGVECGRWDWQNFEKVEPLRCGFEGGLSSYRRLVGYGCRQRNANGSVVQTYSVYFPPGFEEWLGCK